jgi:hypothetical protein
VSCHDERGLFATQLLSPSFQRFGSSVRLMQIENATATSPKTCQITTLALNLGTMHFQKIAT